MKIPKWLLPLLSLTLIAFLLSQMDLPATAAILSKADLLKLLLAMLVTLASLGLKTLRWKLLLAEKKEFSLRELFPVQAAGIATSNFSPGKMLEAVKVVPLKERGVSYSFGIITVFWERAFDLVVLFGFALTVLPVLAPELRVLMIVLFAALLGLMLVMFRHYEKLLSVVKKFVNLPLLEEVKPHHFRKTSLATSFAVTAVAWACDAAAMLLCFSAVGLDYDFMRVASAYFASVIVGVISFLPGGLGSLEASFILLLSPAKETLPQVFSSIVLGRIATLGFSSVLGFALLPLVKKS